MDIICFAVVTDVSDVVKFEFETPTSTPLGLMAPNLVGIYFFKVNNGNTRIKYEICSKLIIKTPERRQRCRFGIFIVNFKKISHIFRVFPLLLWCFHSQLPTIFLR